MTELQNVAASSEFAELEREVARRRTFAIISHPDAGKTTLTEKLLLYAGAIELAGAVRGRKARRHATSDWMELEQERGISITSAALEFELEGRRMSLIDTPGHNDFSEDTYRALIAADSVVMVIDAANGVEDQTRKLFEVCRRHRLPILTFINKFDRPARDPLELLDDLERTLGIAAAPVNWPIGSAERFRGVYDIEHQTLSRYQREAQGQYRVPVHLSSLDDPDAREMIGADQYAHVRESLDVIREAGTHFDLEAYRAGRQTPVFFGSALTNFGLEPFLQALVELAPSPQPRQSDGGVVAPTDERFTGFVFKIQANMDPRHRDRVAFVRVCSGRFTKDMVVSNSRLGTSLRASRAYRFFGRDRETISVAYAGDIIGLVNPGQFAIGDTLHSGAPLRFPDLPRFPAEHFGRIRLRDTRYKQFDEGVRQLEEEGLMQVFYVAAGRREPIVGVVGALQYDVIASRLRTEYGVSVDIDPAGYAAARWLGNPAGPTPSPGGSSALAVDRQERRVILFASEWELQYFERHHPDVVLLDESPAVWTQQ
ncbi:MAG: peptide chain release factor 3 [Acidobacteria bacterium RIFCSPLOWO2_12_FULL_65_11]|nr:MAG: peptide chain release factor 3 [Acidobacteria bacterium RIFCSPLOWO2_02_FULL_64_15]OFW30507.1 MAG: peptide chain release factor 3 [Acidobacteria bacterium RIFCSPLOWO2_12_FULL_65_11]